MSVPADKILCTPLTITGSIGVIMPHINFEKMWEKVGITFDSLRTDGTPEQNFFKFIGNTTELDREKINKLLDEFYESFKSHVATARKFSPEEIEERAQGRVWMGTEAKERNLVDEVENGTYFDAV